MESGELSKEQITATKEKYAGIVLSDRQVIDLVSEAESVSLDEVVQWYGVDLPEHQRPIVRFSSITKEHFNEFSPKEKLQYLKGASALIFGGLRRRKHFPVEGSSYITFESVSLGDVNKPYILRYNIGQLLSYALEFCNGNVDEARKLLNFNVVPTAVRATIKPGQTFPLYEFFDQVYYPDVKEILAKNPKVASLAFWLDVDLGDFNPNSSTNIFLFEGVFPRADISLKTEILKYTTQLLLSRKATKPMTRSIPLLLMKGLEIYKTSKKSHSSSVFVEAYESLKDSLELVGLFDQLKNRKTMETETLVEILEKHPSILDYVSQGELDAALDVTKDHGVALRLERLIKSKKSSKNSSYASE